MKKIPRGDQLHGLQQEPDDEEAKVLQVLQDELMLMGAPVLDTILKTSDPERSRKALLGKYRPSTVRRYLAYWQGFLASGLSLSLGKSQRIRKDGAFGSIVCWKSSGLRA